MAKDSSVSPSEHQIQCAVIDWRNTFSHLHPALCRLHAIPNGARVTPGVAGKLKAEGLTAGVPDLFLPYPAKRGWGRYYGLYIELKTGKGRVSPPQQEWVQYLRKAGYRAEVCRGVDACIGEICEYLGVKWELKGLRNPER